MSGMKWSPQLLDKTWEYFLTNQDKFWDAVAVHLKLSGAALLLAILIALPAGIIISRYRRVAAPVIYLLSLGRTVPSLGILALALPLLGTGFTPALLALTVLAIPPVLINTYVGLSNLDPAVREAAYGMGMTTLQVIRRVELPMVTPIILAGIRITSVEVVASATIATLIGAGGLGHFILTGLAMARLQILLTGAIPVTLLTLATDAVMGWIQRAVTSKGLTA